MEVRQLQKVFFDDITFPEMETIEWVGLMTCPSVIFVDKCYWWLPPSLIVLFYNLYWCSQKTTTIAVVSESI
jgi:hypothetical protein